MHPGRGARFLARVSRRGASPDEDPGIARRGEIPTTPTGCRTYRSAISATPWRGRIPYMRHRFPGTSALRASTPGLKADDPYGATPLRDRQAGSSLMVSAGGVAPHKGCRHACEFGVWGNRLIRHPPGRMDKKKRTASRVGYGPHTID